MEKKRLFYLDFIRAIALFIILIVHFNATITNMFTLPSKFTGSVLPGGIYLGELGSGLFFMISGAALGLTLDRPFRTGQFYQKRVKAIYPMFYIAFLVSFGIRFTENPAYYAAVPSASILYTVFGIDMFAMSVGWSGLNFACVGEWFTGVILILYLMFPVFRKGVSKVPFVTAVLAAALFIPLHLSGIDRGLVFLNALKFLFGIYFTKYRLYEKKLTAAAGVILSLFAVLLFPPLGIPAAFGALFLSAGMFMILSVLAPFLELGGVKEFCGLASRYSYAAFLVHHVLIQRMVRNFDLETLRRRDAFLLFGIYLTFTAICSVLLYTANEKLNAALKPREDRA